MSGKLDLLRLAEIAFPLLVSLVAPSLGEVAPATGIAFFKEGDVFNPVSPERTEILPEFTPASDDAAVLEEAKHDWPDESPALTAPDARPL